MRFTAGVAAGVAGIILLTGGVPAVASGDLIYVGREPLSVVIDAEGTAYIGNYSPGGGVSVLPAGAGQPATTLIPGFSPAGMALSGDGTLFVEGWDYTQQQERLAVIPKGSSEVARTIPLSRGAHLIAASPDGTVFVPNPNLGTVSVIPPGAGAPAYAITVGGNPKEVAVAKDGTAYVTNQNDGTVSVIPQGAGRVSRTIDVSPNPGQTGNPHGIAVGPDGAVYVTNITTNDVAVIKPGDSAVAYRVAVPGGPKEVAVGIDSTVYVLYEANGLSVIKPGGTNVSLGLPTGKNPGHLAIAPNGSVIVTNTADASVTVFPAQDLRVSGPPVTTAQAEQPEVKEAGPTAQATSGNDGTDIGFDVPLFFGVLAAAMLLGAAALVLAAGRRHRSQTAGEEAPAEDLEDMHAFPDQRQR